MLRTWWTCELKENFCFAKTPAQLETKITSFYDLCEISKLPSSNNWQHGWDTNFFSRWCQILPFRERSLTNVIFGNIDKKFRKSRYQSFMLYPSFNGFLLLARYFWQDCIILARISKYHTDNHKVLPTDFVRNQL